MGIPSLVAQAFAACGKKLKTLSFERSQESLFELCSVLLFGNSLTNGIPSIPVYD